ncbi:hypothetical protein IWW36_004615, partial [Coemansia brasiliensis]
MSEENKEKSLDFDICSSALLQPSVADRDDIATIKTTKYDPVAQLMESDDSDSDNETEKSNAAEFNILNNVSKTAEPVINVTEIAADHCNPVSTDEEEPKSGKRKKEKRSLKARQFILNKNVKKDSVVGRMMARHKRTVSEDSSDSSISQDAMPKSPKEPTERDLLSPASDSSPSPSTTPKRRNKTTPRAASKAAMLQMHQESERLFRETAVKIDPLEFTQRLRLDGFFEKYDSNRNPEPAISPPKAKKLIVPPLQLKGSFAFLSSGDKQKVMILDDSDNYEGLFRVQKPVSADKLQSLSRNSAARSKQDRQESMLNAILSHGSQPMHASSNDMGMKVTQGPLALRELNTALLDAIHKKDAEEREAKLEKAARKKQKEEMTQLITQEEDGDEGEMDVEEQPDNNDDDGELADADGLLESNSNHNNDVAELLKRGKGRAAVTSDEESETEQAAVPIKPKLSKAEFASKFNMLVREKPISKPKIVRADPTPPTLSQLDSQLAVSQEIPDPLLSQMYDINTQDSLLLTPEAQTQQEKEQNPVSFDIEPDVLPTQMLEKNVLTQSAPIFEASQAKETQPTQPFSTNMDATQPFSTSMDVTQPFQTEPQEEVSAIPTTVPRSLELEGPAELAVENSPEEDTSNQQASSPAGRLHRRGRLLQRKSLGAGKTSQGARAKRPKQSVFVEAEAEEGDSSDSGNEAGTIKQRKFNWGNASSGDDSDEEEWDMDSDEEQAALLADPMIDHSDYEDAEGDQQIRQLHLQQNVDADERDIQELFHDVTTGKLRNRTRMGFALSNDEDYNDRQTRAERMEERVRLRRKLQMREIHDSNLAEIARNPETAAFAQAALMRAQDTDTEDAGVESGHMMEQLEEEVDEHNIASAVQKHLVRGIRRMDSDVESDDSAKDAGSRRSMSRVNSSQSSGMGDLTAMD